MLCSWGCCPVITPGRPRAAGAGLWELLLDARHPKLPGARKDPVLPEHRVAVRVVIALAGLVGLVGIALRAAEIEIASAQPAQGSEGEDDGNQAFGKGAPAREGG